MHIDDLPNDVLCLVLHWTIGVPDGVLRLTLNSVFDYSNDVLHEVKRNLPLLAVCQRWRHMALPMLYSTAAVSAKPCWEHKDGGPLQAVHGGPVVESNVWLVASAGYAQAVKCVSIEMQHLGNPSAVLRDTVEFMRSAMSEWGGVKSLIIKFDSSDQLGDEPVASILDGVAMEAACDAIAAAFPGVSGLCFLANGSNPDPAISKIYGRLTGVYAGRLERLEMEHPADFPRDVVFKRLKRLNVKNYYEPGDQLPLMDPDVLEVLNLDSWPQSQAWATFGSDIASREIRLPRLKALRFVQIENAAENMWRLHLPSVEWLEVRTSHVPCSLLEHMTLPPRMATIKIRAGSAVLRAVARMVLPAVQHLEIDIPYDASRDPTVLLPANHILSNARVGKRASLIFQNSVSSVSPDDITCTTLTHLSVGARTRADVVLALICKLPSLVTAMFWSVSVDDMQTDISTPGPDDAGLVEPFDAKIKRLVIGSSAVLFPEQLAAVVKHMVLRMPALTWVHGPRAIRGLMEEFVCTYSKRYPHLNYVKHSFS